MQKFKEDQVSIHTSHMETRTSEDPSVCSVTHQVVSRFLLGAVQAAELDAQDVGGHGAIGAAGQADSVQSPIQGAGVETQLRAERAGGRQTRANSQDGILRGDHGDIWMKEAQRMSLGRASF